MTVSSGSVWYLFRVSVAQHQVGSFNVSMDILILMDELQNSHLQVKQETLSVTSLLVNRERVISPIFDPAGVQWPFLVDLLHTHRFSEGHFPDGPWP